MRLLFSVPLLLLLLICLGALAAQKDAKCTGDKCTPAEDRKSILAQRTQDYWYSMWKKDPALYDKVTSYFTADVELWANGGMVVKGQQYLSQSIRTNGIVLYDNYIVTDFTTWVSDNSVWAEMKRGVRNLGTNDTAMVLYLSRVEFNDANQITRINEFPNYEMEAAVLVNVVPDFPGSAEFYMCRVIMENCPTLTWGLDAQGKPKSCYQVISTYRETDPDYAPRFVGASKRCIAINLTSLNALSAPMVCPLFAKGNGSPSGCWDS